jgi:hypothetical protein
MGRPVVVPFWGSAMSVRTESDIITRAAYAIAWAGISKFKHLTPDERMSGPGKLKEYVEILVATGEENPEKIACCALGLIREYEQIARSKARFASPSIQP